MPKLDRLHELGISALDGATRLERDHFEFGPSELARDEAFARHHGIARMDWFEPDVDALSDGTSMVRYTWKRLQHHDAESLEEVVLEFRDYEAVAAFELEYDIRSDELPEPLTGELRVIPRRIEPDWLSDASYSDTKPTCPSARGVCA